MKNPSLYYRNMEYLETSRGCDVVCKVRSEQEFSLARVSIKAPPLPPMFLQSSSNQSR
jgi:hypothetical protein